MISDTSSSPDILSTALEIKVVLHNPALDEVLLYYISLPILTTHPLAQIGQKNFLLSHRTPRYESGELAQHQPLNEESVFALK